jgi:3-deoxy-D-manno-octulosonic-acid transferase
MMALLFYNLVLLLSLLFFPVVKFKARKRGKISLLPRFNSDFQEGKGKILLHVASIGEVNSVKPLVERLKGKIALTVFTDYGLERAKKVFPDVPSRVLPIDFYPVAKSFLKKVKPSKILIYETEIWPSLLYAAKELNIPVYIISGKITEKSLKNFKKFRKFLTPILKNIVFLARSKSDFERAKTLGFKKVELVGDLKLAVKEPLELANLEVEGERKIIIWGSTHKGEEELAFKVHERLRKDFPNLLTIIAPRHINRVKEITPPFPFALRSKTKKVSKEIQVYIVDTIGELASLYRFADVVIIGGSFVKGIGGHNPLEAVIWEKLVVIGKYGKDFIELARELYIPVVDERKITSFLKSVMKDSKLRENIISRIKASFEDKREVVDRILGEIKE